MPLVEATTLTYLGKNAARYGRLRSWGSVGFIMAVLSLGYAFDYIAISWILWAGLLIQFGILYFSRQIPPTEVIAHHTDSHPIMRIVMRPQVLALFGSCFLMAVAHGPYYTFFRSIWSNMAMRRVLLVPCGRWEWCARLLCFL